MTHICISKLTIIGSDNSLSLSRPKQLPELMLDIDNWTPWNIKLQRNPNQNFYTFIQGNAFENVRKLAVILPRPQCANNWNRFNSLAPVRSECDSKNVIFNLVLLIGFFRSSHDNALQWMPHDFTDDKWTLVQVMACCRQATNHYLSQCWLSSLSPYGVARPQWVNPFYKALFKCTIFFNSMRPCDAYMRR